MLSVIIPCFNRAAVLHRAIESVLAQSKAVSEIIVVDDGSTDQTSALLKYQYPTIKTIRTDNHGVSHARNIGIQAAKYPWIALLDSDDAWAPHKWAAQNKAITQSPTPIHICHTGEIWLRNGRIQSQKKFKQQQDGWIYEYCLPRCIISPSSVVIHQSVFQTVGYFDTTLPACEDYDLWLRICAHYPVKFIPEALILKYGGASDQLSMQYRGMDRFRIQALENMLQSPTLLPAQKHATRQMLIHKLQLHLNGARKHHNQMDIDIYAPKLAQYTLDPTDTQNTDDKPC